MHNYNKIWRTVYGYRQLLSKNFYSVEFIIIIYTHTNQFDYNKEFLYH